eukprot:6282719-Pyramimonas_sp.AAC.1
MEDALHCYWTCPCLPELGRFHPAIADSQHLLQRATVEAASNAIKWLRGLQSQHDTVGVAAEFHGAEDPQGTG